MLAHKTTRNHLKSMMLRDACRVLCFLENADNLSWISVSECALVVCYDSLGSSIQRKFVVQNTAKPSSQKASPLFLQI